MESTLIISAGMPRSGSTWLFNAIRLILSSSPKIKDDLACGWVDDWKDLPKKGHTLIKVHDFDEELADRASCIIYSYRDVRDSLASILRKFKQKPSIDAANRLIQMYEKWTCVADLIVPYEDIVSNKCNVINDICKVLYVPSPDASEIQRLIESMSYEDIGPKNDIYNYVNLFHKDHITDGRHGSWIDFIDLDLVKQIETTHHEWFNKSLR